MVLRLLVVAIAAVCVAMGCADTKEPICLRQTCEERYRWVWVPIGEVFVRQKQVRTICTCHEQYVPGEPKPEEGQE